MHTFANNAKTAILMGAMVGLFLLVGSNWGAGGMLTALILGGVMNVVSWFYSDKIAIKAMQGREITPDTSIPGINSGWLYETVDRLRERRPRDLVSRSGLL